MAGGAISNPIVGVSLKMYFTRAQTRDWLRDVAAAARNDDWAASLDVFVLPGFLSLAPARAVLAGSGVSFGAQDVFWEEEGPYTGEVSAASLREVGCRYVAVGHAERRRLFGEDDETTARKAAAAVRHGLIPVVCVGESARMSATRAAATCLAQIAPVLDVVGEDADVIFAYEPLWAIGQASPAEPSFIVEVANRLRQAFAGRTGSRRLVYGGSAGPGLFADLSPSVDGLFLGRFAHDVKSLRVVASEVQASLRRSAIRPS